METVERFTVLETYVNSIRTLAQGNEAVAYELAYRIMQYWIYGEEPPKNSDPIILAFFNQIKVPIDNGRKQMINWSKGWRPKKGFENLENSQKPKLNPNLTQTKPNSNPNETKIKNKKEKIKENIKEKKSLFWDFIELTPTEYSKLKDIFWEVRLRKIINEVDNSIGMHGYRYESHYRVILKRYAEEIENLRKKGEKKKSQLPDYNTLDPILMP